MKYECVEVDYEERILPESRIGYSRAILIDPGAPIKIMYLPALAQWTDIQNLIEEYNEERGFTQHTYLQLIYDRGIPKCMTAIDDEGRIKKLPANRIYVDSKGHGYGIAGRLITFKFEEFYNSKGDIIGEAFYDFTDEELMDLLNINTYRKELEFTQQESDRVPKPTVLTGNEALKSWLDATNLF